MSRSKHTKAQIIAALKQVEAGRTVERYRHFVARKTISANAEEAVRHRAWK